MKILVCGDRNWIDPSKIVDVLSQYPQDTAIIHGGARGADNMAGLAAEQLGLQGPYIYMAKWDLYGNRAGPIRNREMYDTELPDLVIAFHNNISKSKGTKDMVEYAKSKGCPVLVYTSEVTKYWDMNPEPPTPTTPDY